MKYFRLKELQQAFGENGRLMGGHDHYGRKAEEELINRLEGSLQRLQEEDW